MVSSPIGGFMPIPLAMMPAFMAYQSMLMGDAFGQGYQYGKRKISAMTNEDFNKLSISQLFENATIEYDRMIPTLERTMQNSQDLQGFIVKELLAIIPNLIKDAFGQTDEEDIDSPFFKNTQATQSTVTGVRYTTDRNPVFNEPAIKNFQQEIDKSLTQRGTKDQTASEIAAIRAHNLNQLNTRVPFQEPVTPVTVRTATKEEQEFNVWSDKLFTLQKTYQLHIAWVDRPTPRNKSITYDSTSRMHVSRAKSAISQIRAISNDYRNPNNLIRKMVLQLRQQIANGKWQ